MEIKLAKDSQLLEVVYILKECTEKLIDKGVKSWHNMRADYSEIIKDISNKFVYLVFLKCVPVGTFTIRPDTDVSDILHIDRLAVFPVFQNRGLAKAMIDFAEKYSRDHGVKILRGEAGSVDIVVGNRKKFNLCFKKQRAICHHNKIIIKN